MPGINQFKVACFEMAVSEFDIVKRLASHTVELDFDSGGFVYLYIFVFFIDLKTPVEAKVFG